MTLDEAIKHCKEKAKELGAEGEQLRDIGERVSNPNQPYNEPVKDCLDCANEHEQLAEWLEDYKRLLEEKTQGDLISRAELKEAIRQRLCISSLKYLTEQEKVIVEEIDNATGHNWKFYYDHGYKQAKRDLKRPQGAWIYDGHNSTDTDTIFRCSVCHREIHTTIDKLVDYPFCHCGAQMRGGAE